MDNSTFEAHIRRLDNQIQALKSQLAIAEEVCSQLVYRIQILECGDTDVSDPHYLQLQGSINALHSIKPLRGRNSQ